RSPCARDSATARSGSSCAPGPGSRTPSRSGASSPSACIGRCPTQKSRSRSRSARSTSATVMPTADVLLGGDCTGSKTYGLSFIAGYVDTAVFVGLFGLFTAHVTGNFVLIGSELVHRRPDVWPKLLAFPVFVVAVAAAVKIV